MTFLDDWYGDLPENTRGIDDALGRPLYWWMGLLAGVAQQAVTIADRITYLPPDEGGDGGTSDLVDPDGADIAWLPWLAQIYGVTLPATTDPVALRDAVRYASGGWLAGTKQAMADAARSALTGSRYVKIIPHWGGDRWTVMVQTRSTETPDAAAVLAAIASKGAAPAGVIVLQQSWSTTWALTQAAWPTWSAVNGKTWSVIGDLGAPTG